MEQHLIGFNVFIINNANLEDAVSFAEKLGVRRDNILTYEQLSIDNVRQIKDISSVAEDEKRAFLLGKIGFDAQNALLKLLEEYEENRYFILYKSDGLLDTIRSRAQAVNIKKNRVTDEALLEFIEKNDMENLILKIDEMKNLPKEAVVAVLESIAYELSYKGLFYKTDIINKELLIFKQFNLNQKLFLLTLFFKLSGGS